MIIFSHWNFWKKIRQEIGTRPQFLYRITVAWHQDFVDSDIFAKTVQLLFYFSNKDSAKNLPNLKNTSLNLMGYTKNNLSGKNIAVNSNGLQSLQIL